MTGIAVLGGLLAPVVVAIIIATIVAIVYGSGLRDADLLTIHSVLDTCDEKSDLELSIVREFRWANELREKKCLTLAVANSNIFVFSGVDDKEGAVASNGLCPGLVVSSNCHVR
jgi:hypothetical protein